MLMKKKKLQIKFEVSIIEQLAFCNQKTQASSQKKRSIISTFYFFLFHSYANKPIVLTN